MNEPAIRERLDACLLTDQLELGHQLWAELVDPFGAWEPIASHTEYA